MVEVLIYGFPAYDILEENPSEIVMEDIASRIDADVEKVLLSSAYSDSEKLVESIEENRPDIVLGIGADPDSPRVQVERVAINFADNKKPDEEDEVKRHQQLSTDGRIGYKSNIDIQEMSSFLKENDIPAEVSYHADTYVCNAVYYNCLKHIQESSSNAKAVFVHLPLHPEEVNRLDVDRPSFPTSKVAETLTEYLEKHQLDNT